MARREVTLEVVAAEARGSRELAAGHGDHDRPRLGAVVALGSGRWPSSGRRSSARRGPARCPRHAAAARSGRRWSGWRGGRRVLLTRSLSTRRGRGARRPGLIRGVRLVFLAVAAFAAAAGWALGHPLPLVVALVIAGIDVIETSFLLLVVGRR